MFVQFCLTARTLRVSFVSQFALQFVRRLLTLDVFTSSFSFNESLFSARKYSTNETSTTSFEAVAVAVTAETRTPSECNMSAK